MERIVLGAIGVGAVLVFIDYYLSKEVEKRIGEIEALKRVHRNVTKHGALSTLSLLVLHYISWVAKNKLGFNTEWIFLLILFVLLFFYAFIGLSIYTSLKLIRRLDDGS